jgi:hypothetical protein
MHNAEALPTDWLELAHDMRRLAEMPETPPDRREMYLRSAMHYETEALAAHFATRIPLRTEELP